ncbi:MmcQ/YjbR family DNA-binding protein [Saccharomonospora sp. CUA-673]|uniref:MmcQ/YjbR family DNA-binding protein n=1 Tax=Saccharomonospora sp. CUA-673 TaxID=1904969 RepID=UPI0021012CC7|nr:MmcQ/YjbR family DNA-binding protein [Saccharomonospora sp. CUA-673]
MKWEDVVAFATELPEVTESTLYGTPALKVGGKSFARLRTEAEGGLVLMCGLDAKETLLASGDPAFSTTPHYDGCGVVVVDLGLVDAARLRELVEQTWHRKASKRVKAQL